MTAEETTINLLIRLAPDLKKLAGITPAQLSKEAVQNQEEFLTATEALRNLEASTINLIPLLHGGIRQCEARGCNRWFVTYRGARACGSTCRQRLYRDEREVAKKSDEAVAKADV